MEIKAGVEILGIKPELLFGMMAAESVFKRYNSELIITEVTGGKHSPTSRHYIGHSFDCRRWHIDDKIDLVVKALKSALGENFFVLLEKTHIHVSYKPRR